MKKIIAFLLYYSGLELVLRKAAPRREVAIFMFHSVQPISEMSAMAGYSIDVARFERDLKFIRKYNVISMSELIKSYATNNIPTDAVVITFDDGYKDNYQYAYPMLKKYKLPATIYLTSTYIGSKLWLPLNRFYHAVLYSKKTKLNLSALAEYGINVREVTLTDYSSRMQLVKTLRPQLKNIEIEKLEIVVSKIEELLGITELYSHALDMLSWAEVGAMQDTVEFGSHTCGHAILSKLSDKKQEDEIAISRQIIEQNIKSEVKHFAYPNGHKNDYTKESIGYLKKHGYESAVTTEHGLVSSGDNKLELKRISTDLPRYLIAMELLGLYQVIKKKRLKSPHQ